MIDALARALKKQMTNGGATNLSCIVCVLFSVSHGSPDEMTNGYISVLVRSGQRF